MPRTSWFDDKAEHPVIQEQIQKLKSFTDALAYSDCDRADNLSGQVPQTVDDGIDETP